MKSHHVAYVTFGKLPGALCLFILAAGLGCERTGSVTDTQGQDATSGAGTHERRTPERVVPEPVAEVEPTAEAAPAPVPKPEPAPRVVFETSKGNITLELNPEKARISVANFLAYVNEGFYEGTIFHRVIPGFMVQGGGFTADMKQKPTRASIKNECTNGLKNVRGSIAMARTRAPDSATTQFFINVMDNEALDYPNGQPGYAVFGKVVEGMDVADAIVLAPTTTKMGMPDNPVDTIFINAARVVKP